ncbi:MAG: hypothetical protein HY926_09490 [Elusimicrobia bacterium]|nr:hypothetical protein [Elusimicrobiota bacterium]
MRFPALCAVVLFCAPALQAAPSQTAAAADDRLRALLSSDAKVREKIGKTQSSAPVFAETDLKDAVADRPADPASERQELLARLPGLRAPRASGCADFKSCSVPPLAMDIPAGEPVEHAIRAMLRPWIWLADARGARLAVAPVAADGAAILAMNVPGLGLKGVELNIAPGAEGGVHLWFSRALELAEVYSREREAIQKP